MHVVFLKSFLKDINKIKNKNIKNKLKALIIKIENAKNLSELNQLKKLKGYQTAYRIRMGDFRVGLYVEEHQVILARVLKRNDIYKLFPSKH